MALTETIFTLERGVQLIWAAFDLLVTVVSLKVVSGLEKTIIFGHLKNNHTCDC